MLYKTMVLELIQDNPTLYETLRSSKRLLPALDAYAIELKASHEDWKARLAQANPGRDPRQIAAEAMELAVEGLRSSLSSCGSADGEAAEPRSLDAAMSPLRQPTPAA